MASAMVSPVVTPDARAFIVRVEPTLTRMHFACTRAHIRPQARFGGLTRMIRRLGEDVSKARVAEQGRRLAANETGLVQLDLRGNVTDVEIGLGLCGQHDERSK